MASLGSVPSIPSGKAMPTMPLVPSAFLPTAPHPKTTEDIDFLTALRPCIIKGKDIQLKPLLDQLTECRRTAVTTLDPTRTIVSQDAIITDAVKYLTLIRGFREASTVQATSESDSATEEKKSDEAKDERVPALASLADGSATSTVEDDKTSNKKKKAVELKARSSAADDGSLRHMMPFLWRDLGDSDGASFRMGDTMLEEASVMVAIAQVLLQKAKSEVLNESTMLDIFQSLRKAAGAVEAALNVVREANAPSDEVPDDLKANMIETLMAVSMAQAQHITLRKAQMQIGKNAAITHNLIARICNDTAERYRSMERVVARLVGNPKKPNNVAKYFVAHMRYKQLYFLGMGYSMMGMQRVGQDDDVGCASGIRNLMTAADCFEKASVAANAFCDTARTIVYVDTGLILMQLDECQAIVKGVLDKAKKTNDTVFFKPIPAKADALPDRMSNIKAEPLLDISISPLWTDELYACFDPSKAPPLGIGKVPDEVDCCPVS